jgi:Response regulator containing a CheY-like receiver domain and an HTH DNA-binding domain
VPARILIVEDETLVAMELGMVVEEMGHTVIGIAADSHSALEQTVQSPPDLALVDIHLSDGATGPTLGRRLSERGVSVLFVTSNPDMIGVPPAGTIGVLCKPTCESELKDAVHYALARREGLDLAPPAQLQLLR